MLPQELINAELASVVSASIENCEDIFLVGGVVRDYLQKNPGNDIDFVVKKDAITVARRVADHFQGDFYVLDKERDTARALIKVDGKSLVVDFATLYGNNIRKDLEQRDFTINAIAQRINEPWNPIDPMGGIGDLEKCLLRTCNTFSFEQDPIRVVRAVRFIQKLDLKIEEQTIKLLKDAVPLVKTVSAERKRDEIFHIFETKNVKSSMKLMRKYGLWHEIFPSLDDLEKIDDIPPHVHNALEHTLSVLDYCQKLLEALKENKIETKGKYLQYLTDYFKTYGNNLNTFLAKRIHPQRKYDGLLYLAVLYHDIGKLSISAEMSDGRVRFPNHAEESSKFFKDIQSRWALSNNECLFIRKIISNHTLPKTIMGNKDKESRQALYRFFQKAGSAGVLISLFHLADILATYEGTLTEDRWRQAISTSSALLECWFRKYEQIIKPPNLVNGSDLMRELNIKQGKQVGRILQAIREEQAIGTVKNKQMALEFAKNFLTRNGS